MLAVELHAFVLHFAVGLLIASTLLDVSGLILRRETLLFGGKWTTILGALFAALSVATGFLAQGALGPHSAAGEALLHLHQALGFVLAGVWLPLALWRALSKRALPLRLRTFYLAGAFAGAALVLLETGLGTTLVYQHGLGLSPSARAEPVK
ncbi:MAG TPA: DUF2231 domain-containing protein [Myxococcales bacterium]